MSAVYTIVFGVYHIELSLGGRFVAGGNTGCSSYDEAYIYASKVVASKGYSLERFSAC
jgi:hypothetical protein